MSEARQAVAADKAPRVYRLTELIEEFKRLQVEHGNLQFYVRDSVLGKVAAWPEVDYIGEKKVVVV